MLITKNEQGVTIVELLVTIFVTSIFVLAIYELYTFSVTTNADSRRLSIANDMAYKELRKYPDTASIPNFTCNVDTDKTNVSYTGNGYTVTTSTITNSTVLPNPVVTSIKAFRPKGCSNTLEEVVVTITYGNPSKQVRHAAYVR